jgi:membrane protein YdbS with pleckstrin-like domain
MSQIPPASPQPNSAFEDRGAGPHREADDREEVYYQGSPMIRGQLGKIFLWTVLGLVLLALPIVWKIFQRQNEWPIWWITVACIILGLLFLLIPVLIVKSVRYRISNYRIDYERGIFGKRIDTLELWHVEDIRFDQSFLDRILGVGNITVISHDDTTPKLTMIGIPNPRPLFETLKQRVIAVKRQRGVVKMDVGSHSGDMSNT